MEGQCFWMPKGQKSHSGAVGGVNAYRENTDSVDTLLVNVAVTHDCNCIIN